VYCNAILMFYTKSSGCVLNTRSKGWMSFHSFMGFSCCVGHWQEVPMEACKTGPGTASMYKWLE
jgi:hypothetical protein